MTDTFQHPFMETILLHYLPKCLSTIIPSAQCKELYLRITHNYSKINLANTQQS